MKRVIAKSLGFMPGSAFQRVRPGQVVEVPDDFEANWFEVLDKPVEDRPVKVKRQPPVALSEIGRQKVNGPLDIV